MRESARWWCGEAMVSTLNVGESDAARGVRQVLLTMVASSANKVAKLCIGWPSDYPSCSV